MNDNKNTHRIADDIIRMMERGETPDDLTSYPDFEEYVRTNEFAGLLLDDLSSVAGYRVAGADKERDVAGLVDELKRRQRNRRRRLRIRIGVTAAGAAVIGLTLWTTGPRTDVADEPFPAEKSMPVLIESGGRRIALGNRNEKIDIARFQQAHINGGRDDADPEALSTIVVPAKNMLTITLPDGSDVILNAGSTLKYPASFGADNRRVELTGEAYFKVRESDRPFSVKMGDGFARVYGTEFNAHHSHNVMTSIMLVSGSVGFGVGEREIMMKPGQLCQYKPSNGNISLTQADAVYHTGWLKNEFRYDDIPIADLLSKLSDWYGVEFDFDPEPLADVDLFISSSREIPLPELLEMIEYSAGVTFVTDGSKITVNSLNSI